MGSILRVVVAALALAGLGTAHAAEIAIDIKTDLRGKFYVVERSGTPDNPVLVVKRVWSGGIYYIKRVFDCKARTVQYLGEGYTLKEMARSQPDAKPTPLEEGTIPDQLARYACPK